MTDATASIAQIPLPFPAPRHLTFDMYRPGPNGTAVQQLMQCVAGTDRRNVYLWGAAGSGKSHLLHAVCNGADAAGRRPVYMSMAQRSDLAPDVLEGLEQLALVCVDDLDQVAGDVAWETALFHLFNRMRDAARPLLLAGRASPQGSGLKLADLRSRLAWDLVFRLELLDEQERFQALHERAALRGMAIPDEVLEFLSRRIARDVQTLFAWLDRLDEASLAAKKKLTVPFVRGLLEQNRAG